MKTIIMLMDRMELHTNTADLNDMIKHVNGTTKFFTFENEDEIILVPADNILYIRQIKKVKCKGVGCWTRDLLLRHGGIKWVHVKNAGQMQLKEVT